MIPIKTGDGWEYQRTCTEGLVFDARQVEWEVTVPPPPPILNDSNG